MKLTCITIVISLTSLLSLSAVAADESGSNRQQVRVETLLSNLDRPCGLAVQPETNDVFVSETGAAQIIKVAHPKEPAEAVPVVTGFTRTEDPKARPLTIS